MILAFPENDLKHNPQDYCYKNPEYLGTFRSVKRLSDEDESLLSSLLSHLKTYYSKRNFEVLTFFKDFDKNKIGIVTESQVIYLPAFST